MKPGTVRGHKRVLTRTKQPNATTLGYRTTSWLPECECGWKATHVRYSRIEAIGDHRQHLVDVVLNRG